MPELPPGYDHLANETRDCFICRQPIIKWYCKCCDEFAIDCGCRNHRKTEDHKEMAGDHGN